MAVAEYIKGFRREEPLAAGRWIARLPRFAVSRNRIVPFVGLYGYVRHIDDLVDSGTDSKGVKKIIRDEMDFLDSVWAERVDGEASHPQHRNLLIEGLEALRPDLRGRALDVLEGGMKGAYLDNLAIMYGSPLSENIRRERNALSMTGYLDLFCLVFFGREFVASGSKKELEDMIEAAVRCDAVRDFGEDIAGGLIAFGRDAFGESGIILEKGRAVPAETEDFFYRMKSDGLDMMRRTLPAVFKSGMPKVFSLAFYLYVRSRMRALEKMEYPLAPGAVFGKSPAE